MGTLKPGATYIYERVGSVVYAREFGETKRRVVGYATDDDHIAASTKRMLSEMNEVVKMCETDPAMQAMLEQLFVMYNLKKNHE